MIAFLSLLSACLVLRATATEVVLGQPLLADKFESRPRTRVVNSGEEVTLTCQPKLNDFIFQVWSYFDKTEKRPYLVQSSDPQLGFEVKIVPESDPVRSDLIITSVGERQESFYQCVAFNASMMGYYSDPTQVIIFEPANVAFNVPLPNGDVYSTSPGATAVLGLVVSGKPSPALTLQKQVGSEWITVDDERFFINSSVIRIDPVKVGDSARYQLVANNTNVRSLMLMFEIEVEGATGPTSTEPSRGSVVTDLPAQEFDILPIAIAVGVGVALLVLGGVVVLVCVLVCLRRKRSASERSFSPTMDTLEKSPPPPYPMATQFSTASEMSLKGSPFFRHKTTPTRNRYGYDPCWEVQRHQLQLKDILHESQVVILYKAIIQKDEEDKKVHTVAVKTIKDGGSENDFEDLMQEMMVMSKLSAHANVLGLTGIVNEEVQKMMVIPCMSHGDLVGFLRNTRSVPNMFSVQPASDGLYSPHITSQDLLNVAAQIGRGMAFLHDQGVVHKALCGTNVLMGSNMQVKVTNYGMRNPEKYHPQNYYKWIAPETFMDRVFDKKNDVWAFGVVLWEVVTLGGCPYLSKDMNAVIHQLKSGMRLPHPLHVSRDIYSVMLQCWDKEACNRPAFPEIVQDLQTLWESQRVYIDLGKYNPQEFSEFDDHQSISAI